MRIKELESVREHSAYEQGGNVSMSSLLWKDSKHFREESVYEQGLDACASTTRSKEL